MNRPWLWLACGLVCMAEGASPSAAAPPLLNVNDVSFLFPLPTTEAEAGKWIAADEPLSGGGPLWPEPIFKQILEIATSPAAAVLDSSNEPMAIGFHEDAFHAVKTWKVAGIRIDPSAPSCEAGPIALFGSTPQVRIILQPVTFRDGTAVPHDFAAHLGFDFTTRDLAFVPNARPVPAVPDHEAFAAVVADLVALKAKLKEKGVETDGKLGVHPGFAKPEADMPGEIRALLKKHLRPERLKLVAFMGIRRPEPWIFFAAGKTASGAFTLKRPPQMFFNLDRLKVIPSPDGNTNLSAAAGVATAPLLRDLDQGDLDKSALPSIPGVDRIPKFREVPDFVANPKLAHVFTTDCVSCHTETALRSKFKLAPAGAPFEFEKPAGYEGLKPEAAATEVWNVRNFGWGKPRKGKFHPTAALRTANEAADSAEFIHRFYLDPPPKPVSNALNLVLKARDATHAAQLKAKLTKIQSLPVERNPAYKALNGTGIVHDARFVFLDGGTLAVITTYDDEFDDYLDLFIDQMGDVFNVLLEHVDGWPPATRVQDKPEEFKKFIHDHDLPSVGPLYSAYPKLRVKDIKAHAKKVADLEAAAPAPSPAVPAAPPVAPPAPVAP